MAQKLLQPNAKITLGYWGIRGLGQPIRFLLIAAGVQFSEVRLGVSQDGTLLNKEQEDEDWKSIRATLAMPFPNLPYLIDTRSQSRIEISQSNAILRYLARSFDFYGDTDSQRLQIDILQDQAYDFRNKIIDTVYTLGEDYAATYETFSTNTMPGYLNSFENYLASCENEKFFVGDRLSLVDFVLYELFWQMTLLVPNSITTSIRPTLFSFIEAFEATPEIASYRRSENYIEHPINSPWASFS